MGTDWNRSGELEIMEAHKMVKPLILKGKKSSRKELFASTFGTVYIASSGNVTSPEGYAWAIKTQYYNDAYEVFKNVRVWYLVRLP